MNMLTPFFDWLLTAGFRSSVLVLAILALQSILRRWLGPRARYALWLPVLIVMLTPVFPESRWSVPTSIAKLPTAQTELPSLPEAAAATASSANNAHSTPRVGAFSGVDWSRLSLQIWASGAMAALGVLAISYVRTLLRYRNSRLPVSDELFAQVANVSNEIGLKQVPCIWISASIQSPAVAGLLRPVLLLPAQFEHQFTTSEARFILQHELTHLRRYDLPLNALMCLLIALHWFNPILWLAFFRIRTDREVVCDFEVLQHSTPRLRGEYGHTLLKMESTFAHPRLGLGFVGILQRGAALRSRIRFIAAPQGTHAATKLITLTCIGFLTFFGITRAATEMGDQPTIEIEAKFVEITGKRNDPLSTEKVFAEVFEGMPIKTMTDDALRGVLDDPRLQTAIRQLSQKKGVDLMSAPRVTTQSGQKAHVEASRDFHSPQDPPDKEFSSKKVGVMLDVLPTLAADGAIKVSMNPQVVEFDGFVKDANGKEKPVFSERKAEANAILKSGHTAVLDLGSKTDTQQVIEEVDGKVARTSIDHFTRRAFVFITARLVKPAQKKASTVPSSKSASQAQESRGKAGDNKGPLELRTAGAVRYTFSKANLGDVLRYLAADAGINFISIPEDHPASSRLVTFDIIASPFQTLETICRAHGLMLLLEQDVWYARAIDDAELIGKAYTNPKRGLSETILTDLRAIMSTDAKAPPRKDDNTDAPKQGVTYKEADDTFYVTATRLQHSWVAAYFKGLGRER